MDNTTGGERSAFLTKFFDTVRDMPSTNVQLSVALCLAVVFVLGSMTGSFIIGITAAFRPVPINILPPQTVHENIGQFILIMLGIGTGQFIGKRATAKPWGRDGDATFQEPTPQQGGA